MQDSLLRFIYTHRWTRILIKPFVMPWFSKLVGKFMNSKLSKPVVLFCKRSWKIRESDYLNNNFNNYNDFFTRKLRPDLRSINMKENVVVSPSDGKITCVSINDQSTLYVKHTRYTVKQIFKSKKAARLFAGGYAVIIRLSVDDYHRYCYPISGQKSKNVRISGKFHTVNPIANDFEPIYKENTREFCIIENEKIGKAAQMEVGAMCVGKIVNYDQKKYVVKGKEKGKFEFGGSTIIMFFQKDKVDLRDDLLTQIRKHSTVEIPVKMGEAIGSAREIKNDRENI